jgi:putative oxidoreductase
MIRSLNKLQPWGIFLVRLVLGLSMTWHGFEKLVPAGSFHTRHPLAGADYFAEFVASLGLPRWLGYVSVAAEFLGGILLIFGFLTRFAAFLIAGNMLVALFWVNLHKGYAASEYTLALIVMATLLVLTGAGAASVDRRRGMS